jgi:hypothetical protein
MLYFNNEHVDRLLSVKFNGKIPQKEFPGLQMKAH